MDYQNPTTTDETGMGVSPEAMMKWIDEQQARLDAGLPLSTQGLPPGFVVDDNNQIVRQGWWDEWGKGAALGMGLGIAGGIGAQGLNGLLAGGGAGAGAGASPAVGAGPGMAGASGVLPSTPIGGVGALVNAPASGTAFGNMLGAGGAASGAGGGIKGALGKFLGGIDPTTAVLGGLSLLGGDGQELQSFEGSGRTDPKTALNRAMGGTDELMKVLGPRVMNANPVVLPELPMQIGGGLGMDPSKRMVPPLGLINGQPSSKKGNQ